MMSKCICAPCFECRALYTDTTKTSSQAGLFELTGEPSAFSLTIRASHFIYVVIQDVKTLPEMVTLLKICHTNTVNVMHSLRREGIMRANIVVALH